MKYTYEKVFDEAIKRGIPKEEYARESSKLQIITWIANELAEANRLKRIELLRNFALKNASDLANALGDQA